jgi:hypothetical protein
VKVNTHAPMGILVRSRASVLARALQLPVIEVYKYSTNPITNPNRVSSH